MKRVTAPLLQPSPVRPPLLPRLRAHPWRRVVARTLPPLVALAFPFFALPLGLRSVADHLARRAGASLAFIADSLSPPESSLLQNQSSPLQIGDPSVIALPYPSLFPTAPDAAQSIPRSERHLRSAPAPRTGIRIARGLVTRAISSGVRPAGVPVAASGLRPPGVALHGVSGFGAGLHDGDVVTSVAGAPAHSVGAVVGAVAGALRSKAKVITAVVWRGDQSFTVAVEIPWEMPPHRRQRY